VCSTYGADALLDCPQSNFSKAKCRCPGAVPKLPQGNSHAAPSTAPSDHSPFGSGDAQPVFFYNPEKLQPVDERLTFASITRIECQFFNSPNYCFLSPLYLFTQLLRIKFKNCFSEGLLPLGIFQIHLRTVKAVAITFGLGKAHPRRAAAPGSLPLSPPQGCARGPSIRQT